jgi:hypothetical protein
MVNSRHRVVSLRARKRSIDFGGSPRDKDDWQKPTGIDGQPPQAFGQKTEADEQEKHAPTKAFTMHSRWWFDDWLILHKLMLLHYDLLVD